MQIQKCVGKQKLQGAKYDFLNIFFLWTFSAAAVIQLPTENI
jgi:hypothetical protein